MRAEGRDRDRDIGAVLVRGGAEGGVGVDVEEARALSRTKTRRVCLGRRLVGCGGGGGLVEGFERGLDPRDDGGGGGGGVERVRAINGCSCVEDAGPEGCGEDGRSCRRRRLC